MKRDQGTIEVALLVRLGDGLDIGPIEDRPLGRMNLGELAGAI